MSVSAAPAFKAALLAACQSLYGSLTSVSGTGPVSVHYGWPTYESDEMVILGDVASEQEVGPLSPQRRREETLTCVVTYMTALGGDDQRTITERAYYLAGLLESYLQDSGVTASTQITLGGAVRDARVVTSELTETPDEDIAAQGRTADLVVEVVARVRI